MLKQKFALDFGSKFFVYFVGALTGIIVARVAGPKIIGTVAYGISFVSMFGFFHSLFGTSHIKLISEGQDIGKCNRIYSTLMSLSVFVYILVVLVYFFIKKYILEAEFSDTEEIVIFISLAIISLQALFKIAEVTFIALTQQAKVNLPNLIRVFVYHPARIIVVLMGFGAIALASVNLISLVLMIPVFLFLARNLVFKVEWDNSLFKRYLSIGLPVIIITITNSIILHYGKVMLKDTSSLTELGYFAGGISIASMLLMISNTAGSIFFPTFSKAFKNKDINSIKNQIAKFERFLILFALPFFIILAMFSNPLIPFLMGDKYLSSVPIFSILVFSSFFAIWGNPYYQLITGMNRFDIAAKLNALFLVIFMGLLYFFLDHRFFHLGAMGLAWSMLVLSFIRLSVWYFYDSRTIKIKIKWNIFSIIFVNIIFFAILLLIKETYLDNISALFNFILAFVSIILFYFILFVLKILNKKDVDFLLSILNIRSIFNYTKNELKK